MKNYIHQVVFCSDNVGRATLVTIAYTPTHGVVSDCEKIPPGYEMAMLKMRDPHEAVLKLDGIRMDESRRRCAVCGNRGVMYCDCGVMFCINADQSIHSCPCCRFVGRGVPVSWTKASSSGLLGTPPGYPRAVPSTPRPQPVILPRMRTADWEKGIERQRKARAILDGGTKRRDPAKLPAPRKGLLGLPFYKKK